MNTINYQQRVMFDYDRKVLYFNKRPYALSPVTVSEIATIRKKGKPFFLYKNREELWGTPVPRSLSLIGATGTLGAHMCSYADNVCRVPLSGNDSEAAQRLKMLPVAVSKISNSSMRDLKHFTPDPRVF